LGGAVAAQNRETLQGRFPIAHGHGPLLGDMFQRQVKQLHGGFLVLTELKNRGVNEVFIVCVDGLKGFPEAIETVFPEAQVQLCLVHQLRGSLNYVSWKQRKAVAADLKPIYQASTVEDAEQRLEEFAAKWDGAYPPSARCGDGTGNT
jgi:transposase-like protein